MLTVYMNRISSTVWGLVWHLDGPLHNALLRNQIKPNYMRLVLERPNCSLLYMYNDISETECKYMKRPIYVTHMCIIVVNEYNGINDIHK